MKERQDDMGSVNHPRKVDVASGQQAVREAIHVEDVLHRLHSVRTVQLKAKLERRQLPSRRLAPRGGRRATDAEFAQHSTDNGARTA